MSRRAVLLLTVMVAILMVAASPAWADTFTVNSTGDENDLDFPGGTFDGSSDGKCDVNSSTAGNQCTLRAAIQQANKSRAADAVNFDIPGNGPHTISPATNLPTITKPLTIDGYTQGDATPATSLDDATENTLTDPHKTNAVLKIELDGGVGPGPDNGFWIGSGASNVVIKGLVINRFGQGIRSSGGTGHKVEGNFIGTDPGGTVDEGNSYGLLFSDTDGSTIGGTTPDKRNLISGSSFYGVWLTGGASGNTIQGNLIGTDKDGGSLGNGTVGVRPDFQAGNGNSILSNSIFSNGGLGIDLSGDGVSANDDKDPDTGPNRLQNYPALTSAQELFGETNIAGTLNSTPSTRKKKRTFIIQFFSSPSADSSGYGEGKTFLGEVQVKTDRQGNASFGFGTRAASEGAFITATATNKKTGDTSEFSLAKRVDGLVIGGG